MEDNLQYKMFLLNSDLGLQVLEEMKIYNTKCFY